MVGGDGRVEIESRWAMKMEGSGKCMGSDSGWEEGRGNGWRRRRRAVWLIIIGVTVGDGVVLLLGGTCVIWGGGGLQGKCPGH